MYVSTMRTNEWQVWEKRQRKLRLNNMHFLEWSEFILRLRCPCYISPEYRRSFSCPMIAYFLFLQHLHTFLYIYVSFFLFFPTKKQMHDKCVDSLLPFSLFGLSQVSRSLSTKVKEKKKKRVAWAMRQKKCGQQYRPFNPHNLGCGVRDWVVFGALMLFLLLAVCSFFCSTQSNSAWHERQQKN